MKSYSLRKYYWYHQNTKWFGAIQLLIFCNIAIAILDFSLLPLSLLMVSVLCFIYVISSLILLWTALSNVIILSTIAIANVVALLRCLLEAIAKRLPLLFTNDFKSIKDWQLLRSITKRRSHEPIQKKKQRG